MIYSNCVKIPDMPVDTLGSAEIAALNAMSAKQCSNVNVEKYYHFISFADTDAGKNGNWRYHQASPFRWPIE